MTKRHWLSAIAILLLSAIALVYILPWQSWLERRLKTELAARGFEQIDFHVSGIGTRGIQLTDISFGDKFVHLDKVSLGFLPLELLKGNVRSLQADEVTLTHEKKDFTLRNINASLAPDGSGNPWVGEWSVEKINVNGLPQEMPELSGAGKLGWNGAVASMAGTITDKSGKYKTVFSIAYDRDHAEKAALALQSLTLPWNGGTLRTRDVKIPFTGNAPIKISVQLDKVSLDTLMKQATGDKASATGAVSGTVPVTIKRDGSFVLHDATLTAGDQGTITLAPEVIPGDNTQVALVRELLKNFHYTAFALGLDAGKDDTLSMLLTLRGNNPDVYNGREVRLNVHLSGDLLDLLDQSIRPLADPTHYLKQAK